MKIGIISYVYFNTKSTCYIYLGSIAAFAAIGDVTIDSIIPRLRQIYLSPTYTPEVRLKVGEALEKITLRLGELIPQHASKFFNIFFIGVRDPDPIIAASSLSNIAHICRLLEVYGIGAYIEEVLHCVYSILNIDNIDVNVHRAAIITLNDILGGIGTDVTTVIPHHLNPIYKLLCRIRDYHSDDLCRLHSAATITNLGLIVDQLITPDEDEPRVAKILKIVKNKF